MSAQPGRWHTIRVAGIATGRSRARLQHFLERSYSISQVPDKNLKVVLHLRTIIADKSPADIIIYANDTVTLSSSPNANPSSLAALVKEIEKVSKMSANIPVRSSAISRSIELKDFVGKLDTSDELNRMVAIVLSDTANEIVLREKLRVHHVEGAALDEGIPDKIKRIEKKGELVYRSDEIITVRKLRNDVVHKGTIPSKKDAENVMEISADFLEKA